ncbi:MAG TPA: acylphosphatase [Candidatus Parcubacteria bacterium]|nr:acylphosphatase [Candidatus Parcubacteria bacterium]
MAEMVRRHIFLSGRVQGVFFRENTKNKAKELGIFGWIRNLADGRVEAVFEGKREDVGQIIEWVKKGPPLAKVEKIEVLEQEYQGEFKNFEIKYN